MPINKETIISVFNEKLTLEQWLKTINKALDEAVLTGVEITKKGNATLSFKFTFEDGTYLETNDLVLQQGESVANAFIQNGHLYLTLTNGTNLDAGNVKPVSNFSIDDSQHLIVNYGDGTSQDLGAIFNGNVNIAGNFTANSIIENMEGYEAELGTPVNVTLTNIYTSVVKNGNKITFAIFVKLNKSSAYSDNGRERIVRFTIPSAVGNKLYPYSLSGFTNLLEIKEVLCVSGIESNVNVIQFTQKQTSSVLDFNLIINDLTPDTDYLVRIEQTFLLKDPLIS